VLGGNAGAHVQAEETEAALEVAGLVEDKGERGQDGADEENLLAFFPCVYIMEARRVGKVEPSHLRFGERRSRQNAESRNLFLVAKNRGLSVEELLASKQANS